MKVPTLSPPPPLPPEAVTFYFNWLTSIEKPSWNEVRVQHSGKNPQGLGKSLKAKCGLAGSWKLRSSVRCTYNRIFCFRSHRGLSPSTLTTDWGLTWFASIFVLDFLVFRGFVLSGPAVCSHVSCPLLLIQDHDFLYSLKLTQSDLLAFL